MKADQRHVHTFDFHRRKAAARKAHCLSRPSRFDKVSQRHRDVEMLKRSVAALPEVSLYRVALMKQQIRFGTYRIDTELIAVKMIENHPQQAAPGEQVPSEVDYDHRY